MNAVGYARYSTDKQTDNSIAYQLNTITQYCNKNNINLTQFYSDEAVLALIQTEQVFKVCFLMLKNINLMLLLYTT